MDDLTRLLALESIRSLAQRYALAADGKDLEGLADLFAPDVDNGRFGPGREGVKRFYDQSLRKFHCSVHLVANHVIDFDDDEHAHGVVYCHARHHVLEPEHWFDEALAYFDTYERLDGEWLFRRRRVRSWYRQHHGHPQHGTERIEAPIEASGPKRGARLPEAFPTFDPFWEQPG
ncbi:MAG TPA: nuclear transport factor 2 family protein [Acidimicrobiales bacterium]|nr:nuclear transport factor 2 family protein [Acidimicrobiales bacterium]